MKGGRSVGKTEGIKETKKMKERRIKNERGKKVGKQDEIKQENKE